ncbi:U2 small nuclear ribonucleoprotein auxiliary factor [Hibiscus syriacus]|uniref:U2 small nuclear ribonucleoprotein auxiliary factor n=1 Tax=Hibiscus syriacus TaxID=106335 RepID=A0A6A2XY43_HIBSY|nr:U2 small nuclear ribonucleoprotein auxiliary factor [Hibiscus syriacus]
MMLDHRRRVAGDQISSFNPVYRIHNSNSDGTGDIEFDFWGERETLYYNNSNNLDDEGSEVEFQVEEEYVGDFPSPLWGANNVTDASPLLPSNHFYSNLSPTRRRQIIEEGRKELMEMIRNMPESSYELSLKYLVDQRDSPEMVKEEVVYEEKSFPEAETKNRKAKTKAKLAGSLSRTASMEADNSC